MVNGLEVYLDLLVWPNWLHYIHTHTQTPTIIKSVGKWNLEKKHLKHWFQPAKEVYYYYSVIWIIYAYFFFVLIFLQVKTDNLPMPLNGIDQEAQSTKSQLNGIFFFIVYGLILEFGKLENTNWTRLSRCDIVTQKQPSLDQSNKMENKWLFIKANCIIPMKVDDKKWSEMIFFKLKNQTPRNKFLHFFLIENATAIKKSIKPKIWIKYFVCIFFPFHFFSTVCN